MSSDPRVEAAFDTALELPPEAHEAAIARALPGEPALQEEVRALLRAHAESAEFWDKPAPIDAALAQLPVERPGDVLGAYRLVESLGEGAFGSVWRAEQLAPVQREVALKIIKPGMDSREVLARFEQERQALARLEHPGIAKVFDAGATPQGRPFIAMELVRGSRITTHCQALALREKLDLFAEVCDAIEHAHQRGIIHRDLKPSNILIDERGAPRVIDFGIAKAVEQRLTERTLRTPHAQTLGTPAYMSPEQASASAEVDTRSDVYSLGALLYELLTGRTPIDAETLRTAGLDDVRRLIREVDPPLPSIRVAELRGDLDWIVMKSLDKERARRYGSAADLACDLQRHLRDEVVTARPPSLAYRAARFVRRKRVLVGAGAAVAAAGMIGFAPSLWQTQRADRALGELRATVPALIEEARTLAMHERIPDAVAKLDYVLKLRPDSRDAQFARAHLLRAQLRLAEAAAAYRAAGAPETAQLCDELSAAPADRESLARLLATMKAERRPAAELLPIARRLGEETPALLANWLDRLAPLPIPPERPLRVRLTARGDGLLALDLTGTPIADLAPLHGMPLGELDLTATAVADVAPLRGARLAVLKAARCPIADLSPLRGMPLVYLDLERVPATDFTPLAGAPMESLVLAYTAVSDLEFLCGMPLRTLSLFGCAQVRDLAPLRGAPLTWLSLSKTAVTDLRPLAGSPLTSLRIAQTSVSDLTPLRACPLRTLRLEGTAVTDLAPLSTIATLAELVLPPNAANVESLRAHPALRAISFDNERNPRARTLTATEFWQAWDAGEKKPAAK